MFDIEEVKKMQEELKKDCLPYLSYEQIQNLISKVLVLEAENRRLLDELAQMIHKVNHFDWWCNNITELYEKDKKKG